MQNYQKNKISDKIKDAIALSGLKKKDVAELSGISQVTLSKYINNVVVPKNDNLTKIAKALGLPIHFFLDDSVYDLPSWKRRAEMAEKKLKDLDVVLAKVREIEKLITQLIVIDSK